jgi:hypothetical protein
MSLGSETQIIEIPDIVLEWSDWVAWDDLKIDARGGAGVRVPNRKPGVYEARRLDAKERLTIGKAANLRMRVKQGLVKGKTPHSAGAKIRASENTAAIVVRWAITDTPAAAEEALHKLHIQAFGHLPTYTDHT